MSMSKFSYGNFDSSNTDIAYASTSGYTNPTSELDTRKQFSYPLKELKTFINNTVSVDDNDHPVQLVVDDGELKYRTEPEGDLSAFGIGTRVTALETAIGSLKFVAISQTDYDNLGTKDANTLYFIHS